MPNSDEDSNPNSTLNTKPERPPQLKKSRTSPSSSSSFGATSVRSLFPSVRRVSTSPPSAHQFFVAGNSINNDPLEKSNGGIYDRDWYYPSLLGPNSARNRVKVVKAAKTTTKLELPPLSARRGEIPVDKGTGTGTEGFDRVVLPGLPISKEIVRDEEGKNLVRELAGVGSKSPPGVRRISRFSTNLIISLALSSDNLLVRSAADSSVLGLFLHALSTNNLYACFSGVSSALARLRRALYPENL
ncbi:hypothetical protein GIB67_014452 [Kingdonia uniflora]|uniref:Uncharacterized protein n=1 Tax=Kingdonia uniflora TaxID=39325 RepID=A0A7J7LZ57_9MAGN|nr:hypothetical protein GIB67_014452 [Kingdonia uniflora]